MRAQLRDGLVNLLKISKSAPILIEAKNKKLYLGTYTDYHKVVYESETDSEDFRAVLDVDIARDIIDIISDEFLVEDSHISFKSGKNTTKINLSKETVTLSDLAKGYEKVEVAYFSGKEMKDAFTYVKHASNDKSLGDSVLKGFHLSLKSNKAEVMASNGFVLSLVEIQQLNDEFTKSEILLLNPDFYNALKLIPDEQVHVGYNSNSISLTSSTENHTIRIISSLTKGNPLPYTEVIKSTREKNSTQYVVNKESFLLASKRARVFSAEKASLKLNNTGELDVYSSGDKGETKNEVEVVSYKLKDNLQDSIELKLNSEYLLKFLQSVKNESLALKVNDNSSAVLFEDNYGVELIASLLK